MVKEIELYAEDGMVQMAEIAGRIVVLTHYVDGEVIFSHAIPATHIQKIWWELTKQGWKDQDWLKGDED